MEGNLGHVIQVVYSADPLVQRGVIFHGPPGNGKTITLKGMEAEYQHHRASR